MNFKITDPKDNDTLVLVTIKYIEEWDKTIFQYAPLDESNNPKCIEWMTYLFGEFKEEDIIGEARSTLNFFYNEYQVHLERVKDVN